MTARKDPLPMGSSDDNAGRDGERQLLAAIAALQGQLDRGEITQAEFDKQVAVWK